MSRQNRRACTGAIVLTHGQVQCEAFVKLLRVVKFFAQFELARPGLPALRGAIPDVIFGIARRHPADHESEGAALRLADEAACAATTL